MTNPLDSFLRRHDVDVGRAFAVCGFMAAFLQTYSVIGDFLIGRVSINLGIPIGIFVACGLWEHKSWARTVLLIASWGAGCLLCILVALIFMGAPGNYTLTFGSTLLTHPTRGQAAVFAVSMIPAAYLTLSALHSSKARDEFLRPNQSTDPTP